MELAKNDTIEKVHLNRIQELLKAQKTEAKEKEKENKEFCHVVANNKKLYMQNQVLQKTLAK